MNYPTSHTLLLSILLAATGMTSAQTRSIAIQGIAHPSAEDSVYIQGYNPFPSSFELLTDDGLNIELTESDIIDPFDDYEATSVFLNEHEQHMGLQLFIPGIILTAFGTFLAIPAAIDLAFNEPKDHGLYILSGSVLTLGGSVILTFGIKQMKKHTRWHRRYSRQDQEPDS